MSTLLRVFVVLAQLLRRSRALASMLPALLQSGVLTLAMSVLWSGAGNDFFGAWMEAWLTTWPIVFPLLYLLTPLLRRLARNLAARGGSTLLRTLKSDPSAA